MGLERAYSETGPRIVGFLVATGADEALARDLLHDAVVRVAKWAAARREGGKDPSDDELSALLFATARNLRKNQLRDDSRIDFVGGLCADDGMCESVDLRRDAYAEGIGGIFPSDAEYLRRRLKEAFAKLAPALRETYALYQIGERSVREIAELTGSSENLVKVRLHRAKLSLRKLLGDIKGDIGHVSD